MKSKMIKKKVRHSLLPATIFIATSITVGLIAVRSSYAATQSSVQNVTNAPKGLPPQVGERYTPMTTSALGDGYGVCQPLFCYYYAGASQSQITASGASVNFTQAKPRLGTADYHTLTELAVQSSDGQQIVEVGWIVAPAINGDLEPHIFVYHWVNRVPTCYNGCGFVGVATPVPAGGKVKVGAVGTFKIQYASSRWNVYYNGNRIGYYPESLWSGKYTSAGLIQVFGEVSATDKGAPLSQMGNGLIGSNIHSAAIDHFTLFNTKSAPALYDYRYGNPRAYSIGVSNATSLHFGGPGGY